MYQVLQIQCPGCQRVLKAPVDWVAQPMRCKHCKQVFQSQAPAPQAEPAGHAADEGGFGIFDNLDGPSNATAPRRRRGSSPLKKLVVAAVLLGMVGGIIAAGIKLAPMIEKELGAKVAENKKKKDGDASPSDEAPAKRKKDDSLKKSGKDDVVASLDGPKKDGSATEPMDPPVKKDSSKKKDPPKKKDPVKPRPAEVFPRRALLINVCDYLFWNPVAYGSAPVSPYPGSSTATLAYMFTKPPFNMNEAQITELSDGVSDDVFKSNKGGAAEQGRKRSPTAPWKQVIELTLSEFVVTSRPQDRIVILFAGHVVETEKEAYLVPMEGKKDDPDTLIPLAWVYERLGKCRARQKVLILDVCRFPPAQGLERPAPNEMGEVLDKALQQPPAGVQVWCSCIKDQKSIELEKGSVFLQAICSAMRNWTGDIQEATFPLAVEQLLPKVNQKLGEILGPQKLKQISRLVGSEAEGGAPYNPADPPPEHLAIARPKVDGAEAAAAAEVKSILDEINLQPAIRAHQAPVRMLPPFSSKTLANYKADYISWTAINDLKKDEKKAEKQPIRKAILDAIDAMKSGDLVLQERLNNPGGGTFDGKAKAAFLDKQKNPAIIIFELERVQRELEEVAKDRDAETKRFQAHYDFTVARLRSRLVYVYEYNFLLGQIRADNLPPLEPIHNGWRLGSNKDIAVMKKEARVKEMVKGVTKAWKKVAEEHAGTPWAILAAREQLTNLGLEWRPMRD